MKVNSISSAEILVFNKELLEFAEIDNVKSVTVFAYDQNNGLPESPNLILKNSTQPIVGDIFPKALSQIESLKKDVHLRIKKLHPKLHIYYNLSFYHKISLTDSSSPFNLPVAFGVRVIHDWKGISQSIKVTESRRSSIRPAIERDNQQIREQGGKHDKEITNASFLYLQNTKAGNLISSAEKAVQLFRKIHLKSTTRKKLPFFTGSISETHFWVIKWIRKWAFVSIQNIAYGILK
ncbi:MAG: hypothetical protein JXQ65_15950 [Candidatus Marinimicrobia bacterium]|nr:hypothetical protein [Candidatus Neomarinimicrobiota bacterium]